MSPDRALARQRVLAEFGTVALRCGDRAELLRAAARQTALALGVDHTTVAIHRRETGDFLVEAGVGWPDDCPHWKVLPADPTSMAGRILAEGVSDRAIVAHDPDPDGPVPPGFGLLRLHGLRSTIAAPVVCAGRLVGVIEAASAGINDFEDDIHCLQGLASILGAALTRMAAEAERDRLVAELAEGERRYRFMAEMIPQVVWTATPDGRVDYYNRRWTDYTGLSIESGTRGEWTNVIHPLDEAATLTAWTTAVATGTPYEIEHRIRRADGGWRWMLSRAWPLSDRDGRILRWFGTATDIDDEKRVQQEIAVARDAAERANRAKSRFLAAASHDLRQPLNALGLLVGTLRARLSEPRNLAVVEQIEASVEAMSDLFEGLLDLSKLETGAVELDVRPVSLPALFARLHRELGMEAAAKGLSLRLRSLDVTVRTDATLLERVLRNLLANAIRYTDRGGVMLGVRRRGAQVRVDVIDTGPGIAEEHLEDIFQEFQQLGNPARERGGGHGIGLAIVRRAVDVLGHRLTVRSQPGRGSRFSVDLPLTTEGDAAAASGPTLPGPGSLGTAARAHSAEGRLAEGRDSLPVLLLEDDPLVLMATRMLLEDIGCTVTEARTVDEAEQALIPLQGTGAEPALLLADYRLPGGTNGLDGVLRLRRRVGPRLAAALITGDVTDALEPVARAADVDLLRKPVRPDELHRLIARVRAR